MEIPILNFYLKKLEPIICDFCPKIGNNWNQLGSTAQIKAFQSHRKALQKPNNARWAVRLEPLECIDERGER
jgi:hypothetical protein